VDFQTTILTTIICSGIISTLVSTGVLWHQRKRDFRDDSHRAILKGRHEAYRLLEQVIKSLKTTATDKTDSQCYHWIFRDWNTFQEFFLLVRTASATGPWLEKRTFTHLIALLNELTKVVDYGLDKVAKQPNHLNIFGKAHFNSIEKIKNSLHQAIQNDFVLLKAYPSPKVSKQKIRLKTSTHTRTGRPK
jgi:hypothetical protein